MSSTMDSRRNHLKQILAAAGIVGGGQYMLPERWSRPVVQSVLVPAHAQTTTETDTDDNDIAPAPAPRFVFINCNSFANPGQPPSVSLSIRFTPIDNSGALNGQIVNTRYTVRDSNDTQVFTNVLVNTVFGNEAQPDISVNPNTNPAPWTVIAEYEDESSFGTFQCSSVVDAP